MESEKAAVLPEILYQVERAGILNTFVGVAYKTAPTEMPGRYTMTPIATAVSSSEQKVRRMLKYKLRKRGVIK